MKPIVFLLTVVALGWLIAILAIVLIIFLASLAAWVVITLRSVNQKKQEQADRSPVKRLVQQEQT